jgi:hypothetical protein
VTWPIEVIRVDEPVAAGRIIRIKVAGSCRNGTRGSLIKVEYLLVKVVGRGCPAKNVIDIQHGGSRKLWTRQNHLGGNWQEDSYAFGVEKEEYFIFLDGSTNRTCPLIRVDKRPRRSLSVIEPIIGVKRPAIPVVHSVSVKVVASRFGDVIDVRAGGAPKFSRVTVADHGRFLNLILAQGHIQGPA